MTANCTGSKLEIWYEACQLSYYSGVVDFDGHLASLILNKISTELKSAVPPLVVDVASYRLLMRNPLNVFLFSLNPVFLIWSRHCAGG